jgi:hypothetical protein
MELRNQKVQGLHEWLARSIAEYDGLYEAGSVAVGDPWVDGRSDREIAIVMGGTIDSQIRDQIQRQLAAHEFTDTYLFNLISRRGFLRVTGHHDIAMKFRGQVLFGRDLLAPKETPSREFAHGFARDRRRLLVAQLSIRVLNARIWSIEHLRDDLYAELKLMFLCLADRSYAEFGYYPRRRLDVADAYQSEDLRRIATSLVQIDQIDKDELIETARTAITVLQRLPD